LKVCFWWKYALKNTFVSQLVKQQRFLRYLWLLHNKKVDIGAFMKARIWIQIRTKKSGSATLLVRETQSENIHCREKINTI
jgi:hypothetical protein